MSFYLSVNASYTEGDTFSVSGRTINIGYSDVNSGSETIGEEPDPPADYVIIEDSWSLSTTISLSFNIPDLEFYTY